MPGCKDELRFEIDKFSGRLLEVWVVWAEWIDEQLLTLCTIRGQTVVRRNVENR